MLSGNLLFQHATNNDQRPAYNQHNYSTTINAMIMPNKRWGLDLAYNFAAIQQNMNLCFEGAVVPPGSFTCLGDDTLMEVLAVYQTHTQYGYFALTQRRSTGHDAFGLQHRRQPGQHYPFNVLQPLGPLASTYQSPLAAADIYDS